jgi:hypothetical protein
MKIRATLALACLFPLLPNCASSEVQVNVDEEDLTSLTARSRELSFEGVIYAKPDAAESTVLKLVRQQTQSAFGALVESKISVSKRELRDVDVSTFRKRIVRIINTGRIDASGAPEDTGVDMMEVRYTYKDNAIVDPSFARFSTISSAVLGTEGWNHQNKVFEACTVNDADTRHYPVWYSFDPSRGSCQRAMSQEVEALRGERRKLGRDSSEQLTSAELDRIYLPITVRLGADRTNRGATYPEYDKLYRGGVKPGSLVIGMVYGLIDDRIPAELKKVRPFRIASIENRGGLAALERVRISTGKVVEGIQLDNLIDWAKGGESAMDGLNQEEKKELRKTVGELLFRNWVRLEAPVRVKIGAAAEKEMKIELLTYFGAETGIAVHKYGIKNSDIYAYNGHSYVGEGPLDPTNFTADDFPKSYQLFFIDGCVSYNYYNRGYIPLKQDGTRNLDIISNGLETPAFRGGYAMGQLLAKVIDGTGSSYRDILAAAKATDRMRAVDGELDNRWKPTVTPIVVTDIRAER